MDSWILTAVTFVPLLGAVIAMAMPNDDDELHKRWALAVSLVALGLGIAMLFGIFSLVLARYRIIPDMGPEGKVPSFRA